MGYKYMRKIVGQMGFDSSQDRKIDKKVFCEEIEKVIRIHGKLDFNEDWGVGIVYKEDDDFVVEKHYYGRVSYPLRTKDVGAIAEWLIDFSKINEPLDYGRAMSCVIAKDLGK